MAGRGAVRRPQPPPRLAPPGDHRPPPPLAAPGVHSPSSHLAPPGVNGPSRPLAPLGLQGPSPPLAAPGPHGPSLPLAAPGVHGSPYGPRAARYGLDPVVRQVLLVAAGSVVLALVSFLVAVAVTGDPLGLRGRAVASTVTTVPPAMSPPTTAAPTSTVTPTTLAAFVPPGWVVHTDPATGYQVAVPPGWQVVADGGPRTELRDQSSPTFLRIDRQQDPQADPVTLAVVPVNVVDEDRHRGQAIE